MHLRCVNEIKKAVPGCKWINFDLNPDVHIIIECLLNGFSGSASENAHVTNGNRQFISIHSDAVCAM